ncbi:MAG TPA: hypothetical protein VK326_12185 [Solirubrobacterales bacterium]|nr:hypothetical protein [Solirubrobacterales bacterium]
MTGFSEEQLDAAVKALSDPERFREAERVVARAAPELQRILAQALQSGGWFAESNEEGLRRALESEDPDARAIELRTLLAEEARIGMMVGVAVGWALATELHETTGED